MTSLGTIALKSLPGVGVSFLIAVFLLVAQVADAQDALRLDANLQVEGTSKQAGTPPPLSANQSSAQPHPSLSSAPLPCPIAQLNVPPIPSDSKGNHSVTLRWKASGTLIDTGKNAVGYCVFRRQKSGIPKHILECHDCQIVTENAIPGTGCVDSRVKDDTTYYYVVAYYVKPLKAGKPAISDASNEAIANTAKPDPTASTFPPCHP